MNNTKYSLKRLKTEELRNWFNNPRRKPLVLWGARQVGKTVLVENFLNEWLDLGHVVYRSRNLTGRVNIPLQLENERLFRLYLANEGMLTYQAKVKQSDFLWKIIEIRCLAYFMNPMSQMSYRRRKYLYFIGQANKDMNLSLL